MRHTLKESILLGPVHFCVGQGRSYLCHLCALLSVLKARLFIVTMPLSPLSRCSEIAPCLPTIVSEFHAVDVVGSEEAASFCIIVARVSAFHLT